MWACSNAKACDYEGRQDALTRYQAALRVDPGAYDPEKYWAIMCSPVRGLRCAALPCLDPHHTHAPLPQGYEGGFCGECSTGSVPCLAYVALEVVVAQGACVSCGYRYGAGTEYHCSKCRNM